MLALKLLYILVVLIYILSTSLYLFLYNLLFIVWDMVSFDRIYRLGGTKNNLLDNHVVQQQNLYKSFDCAL